MQLKGRVSGECWCIDPTRNLLCAGPVIEKGRKYDADLFNCAQANEMDEDAAIWNVVKLEVDAKEVMILHQETQSIMALQIMMA